jgi:hypothetical protein
MDLEKLEVRNHRSIKEQWGDDAIKFVKTTLEKPILFLPSNTCLRKRIRRKMRNSIGIRRLLEQ